MRKVICGFLVAVLLLSITVLFSGTVFAEQKNVSVSVSITQSDKKFSMSSSDKVKAFRYGKEAIGSFQISGNINEETTYHGAQAVGLESGTIAFKYNYSGAYLKDSDTSWSLIDDGSREIDSIKLDASIKKGVLLVQKSYDGRTWVNAAPPVVNYFATIKTGNNQFYTADGADIARGTFYRIIIAYKMHKKTGNYGLFNALTSYDEIYCVESYSFYACTNTGVISLHSMLTDESTIPLSRTGYETGGDYKYESKSSVSRMSYGSAGLCDISISGQFSGETSSRNHSLNLARGDAFLTLSYNGKLLTDTPEAWKLISSGSTNVNSIKLPQKMEKGVVIIQSSPDGKDYKNLIEPLCNFFAEHPRGMVLPVKISSKGYYRIIVAYQTQRYVGKKLLLLDNNEDRYHVEIFTFRISKNSIEGIEIEDDGYSLTTLEKGETLTDNATTTRGFVVDKLGTNYEVKINGKVVSDESCITENGYYTIQVSTPLGKTWTTHVYVFRDDDTNGASTYFADVPVTGYRVFRDGSLPTFDQRTTIQILNTSDQIPPLTGVLTNLNTGEETVFDGSSRAKKTINLTPGTYHADLFSGYTDSGSVYHYELNFNIIAEDSKPYVNYKNLLSTDRLSDLSSKYYQVAYQTTRGGYIFVCFSDQQRAFKYAYDIEKRFVEDGRYKSLDNPNVKVKYSTDGEGLIELTQAINHYADLNVEIAFFNPNDIFTYRTLDDPDQLSNLEALSLPESVKVIPSQDEKELMYQRQPFLNDFTFIHVADYDVVSIDAFCRSDNTTYPIQFGIPVDEQLTVSSEYYITETNSYGDTNTYSAFYATDNQTKITWKTATSDGTELTETSYANAQEMTADAIEIVSAINQVDDLSIVTITPSTGYSYSITCLVSDLEGLFLNQKGSYTFAFVDRIGNSYEQVIHITGNLSSSKVDQKALTFSALYNKVYLQDKPMTDR